MQIFFNLQSSNALYKTYGSLEFDSIRLIGKVDLNPLISVMIEKGETIEKWFNYTKIELKGKAKDINYSRKHLLNEENTFQSDFIDRLTQWRIDYVQNLILIEDNYKIMKLKEEIKKIKERLENLEESKTCIKKIVETYKTKPTTSSSDKFIDTIADEKPIKEIFKATTKAFATSLIKGPLNSILSCFVESILFRKRREISDINNLEEKNITKWTDEFTKSINHEQHLAINNKTNFVTNNITSL